MFSKQTNLSAFYKKQIFAQNKNMDKKLTTSYQNLYNSDLKHVEKNLNNFIQAKRENAKHTNTSKQDY